MTLQICVRTFAYRPHNAAGYTEEVMEFVSLDTYPDIAALMNRIPQLVDIADMDEAHHATREYIVGSFNVNGGDAVDGITISADDTYNDITALRIFLDHVEQMDPQTWTDGYLLICRGEVGVNKKVTLLALKNLERRS